MIVKKLEKEIEKLKERVQTLTTGKTKELPRNFLAYVLNLSPNFKICLNLRYRFD